MLWQKKLLCYELLQAPNSLGCYSKLHCSELHRAKHKLTPSYSEFLGITPSSSELLRVTPSYSELLRKLMSVLRVTRELTIDRKSVV